MRTFHTIIVGAGPGGLACAETLARAGFETVVFERNTRIGTKVCAGGIPHNTLGRAIPEGLIERTFPVQHIRSDWQKASISAAHPILSTISRNSLGELMTRQAVKAGASVQTGVRVLAIGEDTVQTDHGTFRYQNLVGADGSSSLVRRFLGLPTVRVGIGLHYLVPGERMEMEWHFDTSLFTNGYAWVFPHRKHVSVGAYMARGSISPSAMSTNLLKWGHDRGLCLRGLKPQAALINYDYRGWRFGNRYLVGDAAGLASGLTGEGIYPAILSGRHCAGTIINPSDERRDFTALLRKHRLHFRIRTLSLRNKLLCKLVIEAIICCLHKGVIPVDTLEMS